MTRSTLFTGGPAASPRSALDRMVEKRIRLSQYYEAMAKGGSKAPASQEPSGELRTPEPSNP